MLRFYGNRWTTLLLLLLQPHPCRLPEMELADAGSGTDEEVTFELLYPDLKMVIQREDAVELRKFLDDNRRLLQDVNGKSGSGWGLMKTACRYNTVSCLRVLLTLPGIDVNIRDALSWTPLFVACYNSHFEVAKMLLEDPRVDVNLPDNDGCSPFRLSVHKNDTAMVKLLLAMRPEVDLGQAGRRFSSESAKFPLESVRHEHRELHILIEAYTSDPVKTRLKLNVELGLGLPAADLFAIVVFLCDDLLVVREGPVPGVDQVEAGNFQRFFRMAVMLPMELQMILCARVHGMSAGIISANSSEIAFRSLALALRLPK